MERGDINAEVEGRKGLLLRVEERRANSTGQVQELIGQRSSKGRRLTLNSSIPVAKPRRRSVQVSECFSAIALAPA